MRVLTSVEKFRNSLFQEKETFSEFPFVKDSRTENGRLMNSELLKLLNIAYLHAQGAKFVGRVLFLSKIRRVNQNLHLHRENIPFWIL